MFEVIVTLLGTAVIFSFGLWSQKTARTNRIRSAQGEIEARSLVENKHTNRREDSDKNQTNSSGMDMAANGVRN